MAPSSEDLQKEELQKEAQALQEEFGTGGVAFNVEAVKRIMGAPWGSMFIFQEDTGTYIPPAKNEEDDEEE